MTVSLIYTAFTPKQESRQRKTSRKQPWNWRHSSVEYVPFQAKYATCTEGQVSSKVCKSFQTDTKGCFLQRGREEVKHNHRKCFLGQSWKVNRACGYQSEVLDSTSADSKGSYKVCHSTVFVFQLSSTVARKCKPLLGDEEIRSRIPVSSHTSVSNRIAVQHAARSSV